MLPGLRSPPYYCCLLFPKSLYFDSQILVLKNLFHFFLINPAIFWYCHIIQPYLLLFNHCYIWYVMSQMFICLNFQVPKNFDFFILQHFLDIVFPPFFRMQVDGISCTDSNVELKLLYYNALYKLSVQFYCMILIKWSIVSPFC